MEKRIAFHSFRRGTGRTSLMSSVTALMAQKGKRVGIIDANLQSPSAHILFDLPDEDVSQTLNNYLWGECEIGSVAYDVGKSVNAPRGQVYLIPSSDDTVKIMRILKEGFEVSRLAEAYAAFAGQYNLDYLLIDTGSGLNEGVLASLAVSDVVLVIMRLDEQDYQGVATTLALAERMKTPQVLTVVNDVPSSYDRKEVQKTVAQKLETKVAAVLPHSERLLTMGSQGIFVIYYPQHPLTEALQKMVKQLM
ncbi:MAG: MinD/ParA family protein [Anaerolineales bacterium]